MLSCALLAGACKEKPKEVSRSVAAAAASAASEAEFAIQIRDYTRAEEQLRRALEMRPEIADWWLELGQVYKRQAKVAEARKAYERALQAYQAEYRRGEDPVDLLQQIYVQVLLGRESEARKTLDNVAKKHGTHPEVSHFQEEKMLEHWLRAPDVQAMRL